MEAIRSRNGCPARMRGDQGTENAHVAAMQGFLTEEESFFFGKTRQINALKCFVVFCGDSVASLG